MSTEQDQPLLNSTGIERQESSIPSQSSPNQPQQINTEQVREQVLSAMESVYSGPIPPPEMLGGYERVLPGASDRILSMAEREQNHRHAEKMRGQIFAFLIAAALTCLSAYLIFKEAYWPAAGVAMVEIGGIAIAFLGQKKQRNE